MRTNLPSWSAMNLRTPRCRRSFDQGFHLPIYAERHPIARGKSRSAISRNDFETRENRYKRRQKKSIE